MRWHRIPLPWRSLITQWQPPVLLTYEQARGPYRSFRHEHEFIARTEGVEIVDTISFSLPLRHILEPIGRLLVEPVVRRQLESILDFRSAKSAAILAADGDRLQERF
jgi:ligand-binding SRPBCC domain-containing protein